jgi:hypothetical protein
MMVHGLCSEVEDSIAKFIHGIGKLDEDSVSIAKNRRSVPQKGQSTRPLKRQRVVQQEDFEPVLGDLDSDSSDNENNENDALCDDNSSDNKSTKSNKDDEEESEKEGESEEDQSKEGDGRHGDDDDDMANKDDMENQNDANGGANDGDERSEPDSNVDGGDKDNEEGQMQGGGDENTHTDDDTGSTAAHNKSATEEDSGHVEKGTTAEYYISRRVGANTSVGVEGSCILKSQDYETMSLVDLCRIEKKNPLPEIPLIEELAIFDQ